MAIPTIIDLADDAFARTHCFAYGGRETVDGETWLRLDVRAADRLGSPDVHGSFLLDSATSQLRSMRLELSRPDRLPRQLGTVHSVRAVTRFLEIAPGLSIIESMCSITTAERPPSRFTRNASQATRASVGELQQLLTYRFRSAPEGVAEARDFPPPPWRERGQLSRSALWCAEQES
jgi:hypothetical protein